MDIVFAIFQNEIFFPVFLSLLLSQLIKITLYVVKYKRINFRILFSESGMPSAHAASMAALTTGVGCKEGFTSSLFIACLVLSIIIINDAVGVRRAAGQQAKILNQMVEEFYKEGRIKEERLKELLGHTPFEVIIGSMMGIALSLIYRFFD